MTAFTKTDKALMDRTARNLTEQAKVLENTYGANSWGVDTQSRKAKLQYDRLMRDARDSRKLATRMLKAAKASPAQNLLPMQDAETRN